MSPLMSPERWRVLAPLLDRVLDSERGQRAAVLDAISGGDAVARAELERLVAECERPEAALDSPLPVRFPTLFETEPVAPHATFGEQFRIERELGRGGMATVYLARDLRHDRDVAIKVLHAEVAAVLGAQRFLSEIRVTANLRHPHILPLFDSGEADGKLYYVMPFVNGESLRQRLRREVQLPIVDALRIAREVAGALDAAHRHGVVHRDIKPENILLGDGQAFVADFGIALATGRGEAGRVTGSGIALGTPPYMSPEQAGGQEVDARTDIYALGAVLYEMLTGEPPFTGPTTQVIVAKLVSGERPSVRRVRPAVSPALDQVIRTALAPVPADRYSDVSELTAALDDAEAAPGVPRRRGRSRAFHTGLPLVALALVAGAIIVRWMTRDPPLVEGRVLVVPFENKTGSVALEALGGAAADNLGRELVDAHLADVVDARAAVGRIGWSEGSAATLRLARRQGAARILRGSYYLQGDSIRFEPQIVESRSGALAEPVLPVVVPAGAPSVAAELLRQRVLASFAILADAALSLSSGRMTYDAWQGSSRPSTYDVYLEYTAATNATERGDREATRQHLARSYALDSNFTLPLSYLALFQGREDCTIGDSISMVLGARFDRIPPVDRAILMLARANCHGWRDVALRSAWELYRAAPGSNWAAVMFAYAARHHNNLRQAVDAMERLDTARNATRDTYWGNLIIPYHLLGQYESELAAARRAERHIPNDWQMLFFEGRALAALGRLAELQPVLDRMENVPANSDQALWTPDWMRMVGRELLAHGQPDEARRTFDRAVVWVEAHLNSSDPGIPEELARAYYDAGRWDDAWRAIRGAPKTDSTRVDLRGFIGAIAARRGDSLTVARTDAWLAGRSAPNLRGKHTFERARLAAVAGDRERADRLLRAALDQGFGVESGVGPHEDPDFAAIREMPAYQALYRERS